MAELAIRNGLCFKELDNLNKKGQLLYKHPLIEKNTLRSQMVALLRKDSKEYLDEYKNVSNNVSRYQSFLNRKKIKEADRNKWQSQLDKHKEKLDLMSEIMQEVSYGKIN